MRPCSPAELYKTARNASPRRSDSVIRNPRAVERRDRKSPGDKKRKDPVEGVFPLSVSSVGAPEVCVNIHLSNRGRGGREMVELLVGYSLSKEELEEELKAERFEDTGEEPEIATLEKEYREAALRVVLQRNDFLLPNLMDMFRTHKTLEVSPYYQRRARWDTTRQSKLIESFLVNIPVPPVFLYEVELANYEIMDGQQRVSAILEYLDNKFALRGLEILKSLDGKRFHELPNEIKAGLQRRSLSAYILLKESTSSPESAGLLRRRVFERLNTGGIRLNAQEIRNSVNSGPFNNMLLELSRNARFTKMWDVPQFEPDERTAPSARLRRN